MANANNGAEAMAARLDAIGGQAKVKVDRLIANITNLAREAIVDRITILNLVDTGFYRSSWQTRIQPGIGMVGTNCEYALLLEYGYDGEVTVGAHNRTMKSGKTVVVRTHSRRMVRPPHNIVRFVAREMRPIFTKMAKAILKEEGA